MSFGTKLLAASAMVLALSAPLSAADLSAETVVATVNGTNITLGHMAALRAGLPEGYLVLPDEILFDGILQQLIQQTALAQIAETRLTQRDHDMLAVQRLNYLASTMLDEAVSSAVSDEALTAAYEAQYVSAGPVREYNAAHILVATEDEAKAIRAELDAGGDFAAIARLKSTDGAAADGGALGWFTLDVMVEPFADAVAQMEAGQIGGPVQTEYGWHLIKVSETRLANAPTLASVRAELVNKLQNDAVQNRLDQAVAEAEIVESVEGIDKAILKDPALRGE
ncbi:peptidylprolyl isomerase [Phaeovulum sp.]|uniref:peptidylprolyl isomerase n=1 Tax=Phaeovulum sp. TaxID=2934796 RepID=UPI002730E7E1|nr:peptidylprolyl isomerase [Phaeovulum sp.]MDP1669015.1 peptidylprolyl isomerase [Phaeovulum sp.]MDZ4117984.1 peptidylprolyl isomerase [Phaeovulum sp.]